MGVLDKFLDVMKLNPDDDDDFYDDDFLDDEEDEEPVRKSVFRKKSDDDADDMFNDQKDRTSKTTPKLTPIRGGKKSPHSNMEVCVTNRLR